MKTAASLGAFLLLSASWAEPARTTQSRQQISVDVVLARARAYAALFRERLSNVTAEERYTSVEDQTAQVRRVPGGIESGERQGGRNQRRNSSDFVLLTEPGSNARLTLRDVLDVNGKPVRTRDQRLIRLLLDGTRAAIESARGITETATQHFNLAPLTPLAALTWIREEEMALTDPWLPGPAGRLVDPRLTFTLLAPSAQSQLQFTLRSTTSDLGRDVCTVDFDGRLRLRVLSNLVLSPSSETAPANGRFWIETATGQIRKADVSIRLQPGVTTRAVTVFRPDAALGIATPLNVQADLVEGDGNRREGTLFQAGRGSDVAVQPYQISRTERITLTYGLFRRFEVRTGEARSQEAR